jgi:hypothetical protein
MSDPRDDEDESGGAGVIAWGAAALALWTALGLVLLLL